MGEIEEKGPHSHISGINMHIHRHCELNTGNAAPGNGLVNVRKGAQNKI
jgi:hypothetical protein